jgi:mannose-6-phosphate isomerase
MPTALPPMPLEPIPRVLPWGSERWLVSDLPGAESAVARGPLAGASLRELMTRHGPELLGPILPAEGGRFPLLLKLIEAREALSVQVHPDEDTAARLGHGARPKTEAWHVLAAAPGAELVLGLQPGCGPTELAAAFGSDRLEALLWRVPARVGEFFYLPAGLVHAIGGGLRLAEVQQTSDTTYRLHDYGRAGLDGRPRPLHREQGLAAVRHGLRGPVAAARPASGRPGVRGPFFSFERLELRAGERLELPGGAPRVLCCLEGALALDAASGRLELGAEETALVPAALGAQVATAGPAVALLATGLWREGGLQDER